MAASPSVELVTAEDCEARAAKFAGGLARAGLFEGDRVAFCLESSAAYLCAIMGAARAGFIPVLLNSSLTDQERRAQLSDVSPSLVINSTEGLEALEACEPLALSPHLRTRPMHFTSGTTGRAKAVTTGLWDEETAAAVFDDEAQLWGFGPRDEFLLCSPLHHTVAVRFCATVLLSGGSVRLLRHFTAAGALSALRSGSVTATFMVPTHLRRIMTDDDLGPDERFESLRILAHAGAPCPPDLKRQTIARCNAGVVTEFYGSTEAQFTFCSEAQWLAHPGSVGQARPGRRLWIEPLEGEADGVGTIWCEVPEFARFSYFANQSATALAWQGTSCSVGDIGSLDEEGYLYLSGRRDDLIITGGVNVYPAEVEAALSELAGVRELVVFALPSDDWGQMVCAAVVTDTFDEAALVAHAATCLAPFKRPKRYVHAASLPMTATGKIVRREVAAHLGLR